MMCENCGKRIATTFVQQTINGKTTKMHLCSECAGQKGIGSMWKGFDFDIGDFWGSLFEEPAVRSMEDTVRCEGCGRTFAEIARYGKAGCPECYVTFYDRLLPSIQRIHGKAKHTGKIAENSGDDLKVERELEGLRQQLSSAIANQEYEKCAELRDRIKELEQSLPPEQDA